MEDGDIIGTGFWLGIAAGVVYACTNHIEIEPVFCGFLPPEPALGFAILGAVIGVVCVGLRALYRRLRSTISRNQKP